MFRALTTLYKRANIVLYLPKRQFFNGNTIIMNKYWIKATILLIIANFFVSPIALAAYEKADFFSSIGSLIRQNVVFSPFLVGDYLGNEGNALNTVGGTALVAKNSPGLLYEPISGKYRIYTVTITAYSSSVDETDDTPFITASGTYTRDGVAAANFLALGSKVQIPELFGNKTFFVEDRMNRRYTERLDIWFPTKWEAKRFGKRRAQIIAYEGI